LREAAAFSGDWYLRSGFNYLCAAAGKTLCKGPPKRLCRDGGASLRKPMDRKVVIEKRELILDDYFKVE